MSMTREEAIEVLENRLSQCQYVYDTSQFPDISYPGAKREIDALEIALSALRPVSREQVEKARWIKIYEDGEPAIEQHQIGVACSKCMNMPKDRFTESKFCPNCGRPMTDEAEEIVVERLEALHDKNV